jgi:two-component system CheB/CheR fusion protein
MAHDDGEDGAAQKETSDGLKAASATHEVKNFADSLINLVYLLRKNPKLDQDSRKYVQLIESELERMRYVINHALARYRKLANPAPIAVSSVLDALLQFYQDKIAAKNIQVEKRYECDGMVNAASDDLRQTFSNLVVNAVQALRPRGRLILHVTKSRNFQGEHGVRVVVADNGVGIPAEHQDEVFRQSFTTKGRKGTGLGLSLTAQTVHERGGTIRFRSSTTQGRSGTAFSVFLPSAGDRKPAPPKSDAAGERMPLANSEGNLPAYTQTPAQSPSENRAIARNLRAENHRLLREIHAHHKWFNLFQAKRRP